MIIRDEMPADRPALHHLIAAAFRDHPHSRQTEVAILEALRAAGALTLSLVAEQDGEVLGQVAASPIGLEGAAGAWFGLGPVAVRPDRQRQGIGQALVRAALARLAAAGAAGCALVGDPAYYARLGFRAWPGLDLPGVPPEVVLAVGFGASVPAGRLSFHPAFATAG